VIPQPTLKAGKVRFDVLPVYLKCPVKRKEAAIAPTRTKKCLAVIENSVPRLAPDFPKAGVADLSENGCLQSLGLIKFFFEELLVVDPVFGPVVLCDLTHDPIDYYLCMVSLHKGPRTDCQSADRRYRLPLTQYVQTDLL
jgi:hypothetical protein